MSGASLVTNGFMTPRTCALWSFVISYGWCLYYSSPTVIRRCCEPRYLRCGFRYSISHRRGLKRHYSRNRSFIPTAWSNSF